MEEGLVKTYHIVWWYIYKLTSAIQTAGNLVCACKIVVCFFEIILNEKSYKINKKQNKASKTKQTKAIKTRTQLIFERLKDIYF